MSPLQAEGGHPFTMIQSSGGVINSTSDGCWPIPNHCYPNPKPNLNLALTLTTATAGGCRNDACGGSDILNLRLDDTPPTSIAEGSSGGATTTPQ